jgi:uracil-DNA glycosylase family 4
MEHCSICEQTHDFSYGLKGERAEKTKLLMVLHRADKRIGEYFDGHSGALRNSATGTILDRILQEAGLNFEDIYLTNFFKCLLPKDRHPTKQEYGNCLIRFREQTEDFQPKGIVIFGNEPYLHIFPEQAKATPISLANEELSYNGTPALVSIHPSQIWKKRNPGLQKPYIKRVSDFLIKYK